jgi:hypothetical protein
LLKEYVGAVLESFNIDSYKCVTEKPENLNAFELLYYKSIGGLFEKYVSVLDLLFKPDLILKLINQLELDSTMGNKRIL